MRKLFTLILCVVCVSGCAGFRQHLADGPGDALYHGTANTLRVAAAWDYITDPFNPDDDEFDE